MSDEQPLESIYDSGVYKCVEKAGSVSALAKQVGVSRNAVYIWLHHRFVCLERAIQLEAIYGVPRNDLVKPSLRGAFETGLAYRPYV